MPLPRHAQSWILWLESGPGARGLAWCALGLAVVLLSLFVSYKQFRGPASEETLRQAGVARQLASGEGFATPVNYPREVAWWQARGVRFDPAVAYPDISQPPLYAALVGGALAVLPASVRDRWLGSMPVPPDGFGGDYVLLAVNLLLLWLAAGQTWALGRRLFSREVGALAAFALLLSAPVWAQTVAVNGTTLMMVLLLATLQALARADEARATDRRTWPWLLGAGAGGGLLFLGDYSAGVLVPLLAAAAALRHAVGRRLGAAAAVLGAALLVVAPWVVRNVQLTGSPVGLAWHEAAWRAGNPTAEPEAARRAFAAAAPDFDLAKLANKGLTALQAGFQQHLWSGGLLLSAFFVAGWLYRFQNLTAGWLRAWFTAGLVLLILAHGVLDSGEGERLPALYTTPLIMVFGAGFFRVLVASSRPLGDRPWLAGAGLLLLQAVPLAQDILEPRRAHFFYPPYHPGVFMQLGAELRQGGGPAPGWMADVPAGAAWYTGLRVWAQPATLRDFHVVTVEQPLVALVLTPATLDRPFFSGLMAPSPEPSRFGDWGRVYGGLVEDRLPADFPLRQQQKLAENFRVLLAPGYLRTSVK